MDLKTFYSLNTFFGDFFLDGSYCGVLYEYYVTGGIIFKYDVNISEDEFKRLFVIIYDSLRLKLSEDEIKKSFLQYIQIVMCDAREGKFVDIYYFIRHIDYLFLDILDNKFLRKAKPVSKVIRKELVSEFGSKRR